MTINNLKLLRNLWDIRAPCLLLLFIIMTECDPLALELLTDWNGDDMREVSQTSDTVGMYVRFKEKWRGITFHYKSFLCEHRLNKIIVKVCWHLVKERCYFIFISSSNIHLPANDRILAYIDSFDTTVVLYLEVS